MHGTVANGADRVDGEYLQPGQNLEHGWISLFPPVLKLKRVRIISKQIWNEHNVDFGQVVPLTIAVECLLVRMAHMRGLHIARARHIDLVLQDLILHLKGGGKQSSARPKRGYGSVRGAAPRDCGSSLSLW
jgi:hypothetical protein